jgi:hypothetical protein
LHDSSADVWENKIPVKVEINDLQVYDEWGFWNYEAGVTCGLKFYYSDASGEKVVETKYEDSFSSVEFINSRIQYLVYDAIYDCSSQFVREFDKSYPGNTLVRDSSEITEIYDYKKAYDFEYTLMNHSGTELMYRAGFGLTVGRNAKDSWFQNRLSVKFSIDQIKNSNGKTTFPGLAVGYSPIVYFSNSHKGLFLNPEVELFLGDESEVTPYSYQRYSIFGTYLNGKIGIKVGKFSLKAGLFMMNVLNSNIADSDSGFLIELGIFIH